MKFVRWGQFRPKTRMMDLLFVRQPRTSASRSFAAPVEVFSQEMWRNSYGKLRVLNTHFWSGNRSRFRLEMAWASNTCCELVIMATEMDLRLSQREASVAFGG